MKDKRKTRLNKTQGTKTEFLGFGAFADAATTPQGNDSPKPAPSNTLRWSPVYTGKDSHLSSLVFPRLIKRDATTKVKALQELQEYFRNETLPKKQQVDALSHYVFLYYSKLSYDSASAVRAEALLVLTLAASRVPKAFQTLVQQNLQILGMMYCCHGDPAADVRAVANKYLKDETITQQDDEEESSYSQQDLEGGIWEYAERILSYGRAKAMHEDLFATSLKSSNSNSSGSAKKGGGGKETNSSEDLNESQRDQLEERFERIVGSALSGIQMWIQIHGVVTESNNTRRDSSFLWKSLASPKASLRRKTYQLLGACCHKAPAVIFGRDENDKTNNTFAQTLPQALASEKEPGNITPLLEALLGYFAAFSKFSTDDASSVWDFLNAPTITKHLVKLFKKSCYGASATQWGPSLLPLLAMLPTPQEQVAVLSAAWKGSEQAVRLGDQLVIAATVSESASYFLLRKDSQLTETLHDNKDKSPEEEEESDAKVLAQIWIDSFQCFLEAKITSKSTFGPAHQAQLSLGKGLARELQRFDEACYDRPQCAIYAIREWFWTDKLRKCILESVGDAYLAKIVDEVSETRTAQGVEASRNSHLSSILREKFHSVLIKFQQSSGSVPSSDAYDIMIMVIKHDGLRVLAPDSGAEGTNEVNVEKFLMNDVLRWMVIHTSSLSTQKQTKSLVESDFTLYGICAAELPSAKQKQIWDSLLREILAAKCDLDLLVAGLKAFLRQDEISVEHVQCDILDKFAIEVVEESIAEHQSLAVDVEQDGLKGFLEARAGLEHDGLQGFLEACAGLSRGVAPLVRSQVLSKWVDLACPEDETVIPPAVLETLLALASSPSETTARTTSEIQRVALQTWRQGGIVWDQIAVKLLLESSDQCMALFRDGSSFLRKGLQATPVKSEHATGNSIAELWSERAWRLLELSKKAKSAGISSESDVPEPSLSLVNLADLSLWESDEHHEFLFACLMYLFRHLQDSVERLQLFQQSSDEDANSRIVAILLALSEASSDATAAARVARGKDRCSQLLSVLGGSGIGDDTLLAWLKSAVSCIDKFVENQKLARIRKSVGLVSQIVRLMFDQVKPRDVFSASEDGDDEDLGDEFRREKVARIIVPAMKKGSFASLEWRSCFAELANVVIAQCGLGQERGIGSLHYDVFQLILGADKRLCGLLTNDDSDPKDELLCHELWVLSLSCGFGLNTPASIWNSQLLMFDADKVTKLLLDYIDSIEKFVVATDIGRAVLAWLITAGPALKDDDLRSRAITRIYKSCLALIDSASDDGFNDDVFIALRGIYAAIVVSQKSNLDGTNLEIQAKMKMIKAFTCDWESKSARSDASFGDFDDTCEPKSTIHPAWRSLSYFPDIISSALRHDVKTLRTAAQDYADALVESLFVESKRWFAFRLLAVIASCAEPFSDPTPEESTARRLSEWTKNFESEEKEELEEDVEIVCEFLPHKVMTEMEFWAEEEVTETIEDKIIIGRAMVWLICLRFLDSSVQKDAGNRPSFCSYIEKCEALESILNLTILHTGIGTDRSSQSQEPVGMDDLLNFEENTEATNLASVVLFRTIEALPSLSRRWWEDECPRVYTSLIRDYVEAQIAPVILRNELERIKLGAIQDSFGAMSVSGSVTTREITATYVQDEIKLKVQIRLASCFPLRSAEVDCSQTLGVPQKRWKLWSLQITQMLNKQGGTLHEALILWKENVDKEFEGVEPCPVCYCVLHVKNHKLPELECTTCSNRFHVSCLTQWFKSSGKTQCVICQQPWVGTRVKR